MTAVLSTPASGTLLSLELIRLARRWAELSAWADLVRHDPIDRFHLLLHDSDDLEVWLLGWYPGQSIDLHDHGGAAGVYAVTEGVLVERWTRRHSPDPMRRRVSRAGDARAVGTDVVHEIINPGPDVATSVHAYAPVLERMHFYDPPDPYTRTPPARADTLVVGHDPNS